MTESDKEAPPEESLEQAALAWVNRLLSGAVTAKDAQALQAWRHESPPNDQAFAEAVRFRRAVRRAILADRDEARAANLPAHTQSPAQDRPGTGLSERVGRGADRHRLPRRGVLGGALAASLAAYMVARPPAGLWPSWSELTSDYRTGPGGRRRLSPSPGVSIDMGAETSLSLRSQSGAPGIELLSGETAVAVARGNRTPFSVFADAGRILLGVGEVDVRRDGASTCVTCLAGAATVEHPDGRVHLAPGRQITFSRDRLGAVAVADLALATAWRRGLLIFRDAPLQTVVDELNRYRPGKILLVGAALAQRPVYGVFNVHQIGGAVREVQELTGARASHLPGGVVVLS